MSRPVLIDVSVPLREGMAVFPGEPGPTYGLIKAIDRGDVADVSRLSMALHSGTHLDAPCHFLPDGGGIETLSPEAMVGPCRVVEVAGEPDVTADALQAAIGATWPERILLRTRNSTGPIPVWSRPAFTPDFAAVAPDAARLVVEHGVRLVGIDYLSMEPPGPAPVGTHLILFGAGVVVLEGIDLRTVEPGDYELLCLPALMPGRDGAPARVILSRTG